MPITALNNVSISAGGLTLVSSVSRTGDAPIAYDVALPVAYSGTLSTRTTDVAGTLTVVTGHTIVTGDEFDLHWVDSGTKKVAYGCTAGTVAAPTGDTSIPFTGASGDALPVVDSTVTFCEQTEITMNIDGDNVHIIGIGVMSTQSTDDLGAHIQFNDSGSAEIAEIDFATNKPQVWDIDGGSSNPFTGNPIVQALCSHANTDSAVTIKVTVVGAVDATP